MGGCNFSKLDRVPAVSLCRDRCKFIDESLRQSYALADAHVAHMKSLRTLGPALLSFFQHFEHSIETNTSISKSPPPSRSILSSSSDSDAKIENTEKESQSFTDKCYDYLHNDTALSFASDNVNFMTYVKPIHDSYPPQPPSNTGRFSGITPTAPPPPPSYSAWDFLNFFEPYEKYQLPYGDGGNGYTDGIVKVENEKENVNGYVTQKCNVSEEEKGEEKNKEIELKEESSDSEKKASELEECRNSAKVFCEALKEIHILFEKASNSGNSILEMLEVGKLHNHSKIELNPEGVSKENGMSIENLCSTLSKLCLWEKKMYNEVKAEEKMRMLHKNKCKQLNSMSKKDADAQKIQSAQAFIDILVTKMKISIQVVDKISITISKLTEEELWPQINRFILMFLGMWKDMQQCYIRQCQKLFETKALDSSLFNTKPCNANIDAAIKLKSEVLKWNLSFLDWIQAQKSHVKALTDWLVKCLMYEPKEIVDDSAPFGAPHVFVICKKWSKAVDNISVKNVNEAVNGFIQRINELLENNILELQKHLTLDKELERKVKILEKQEQKMPKMVKTREKKMAPISQEPKEETNALFQGAAVLNNDDIFDSNSLQSGLRQIFVAMEKFTATTASLYEELCQQIKLDEHVLGESN